MRVNDIYIWGAGLYGEKTLQNCKENGMNIAGFIDSNETLWNTEKFGLVIYPPKDILQKQNVEILIAVANKSVFMEINEICEKSSVKTATFQELKKQQIIDALPKIEPLHSKNSPQYIVSLTSYGERLSATAPYAIATIFQQTVSPDKILLWVAYEDEEIVLAMLKDVNSILNRLVEKGLEIRYCEDIKSYKKLIPAIENFPEDYIITADDDVFYPENWLEQLLAEHRKNPKKIICHRAHGIKVDENHNLLSYNEWNSCTSKSGQNLFPTGVGGILYPPKCFHKDIANIKLFMKLTPKNDDIWFWAMAVINKKYFGDEGPYIVIENGYSRDLQDIEPEQQQDGKALWNYNLQGGNDRQLKAVIEQYPQIREYLQKIEPVETFNFDNFCKKYSINSVIEFKPENEPQNTFNDKKAELTLSPDVIYNLTEDSILENYLETLFYASTKYVIIYVGKKTSSQWIQCMKHRKFTDWNLLQFIPDIYPIVDNGNILTTTSDFYIFGNKNVVSKFKSEKISVLVPVYNVEKYLRQCLDSIINQTYKNIEIICVNDASTDNSLAILNEYAKKDSRIIVIDKHINEDASFARKTALAHSNGQYILPIDGDDWIELNMIENLYCCTVFNGYDICCCGYFEERENNTCILSPQIIPESKIEKMKYGTFGFGNTKLLWNKLVKRDIYEKVVFQKTGTNEDCLITAQLLYYAEKIGFYPLPLYHWQFNENSVTNNKLLAKKRYEDRKMNYEHIIEFCREKFGDDLSIFEPELSRRMADIEKQKPEMQVENHPISTNEGK